jgi:hypothetical protein
MPNGKCCSTRKLTAFHLVHKFFDRKFLRNLFGASDMPFAVFDLIQFRLRHLCAIRSEIILEKK